jgi:hypothetical protein
MILKVKTLGTWQSMKLIASGLLLFLFCLTLSASDDQAELKRQSDAHQQFQLRDALSRHPPSSAFYTGEVACAFNDTCEQQLEKPLAAKPKSTEATQIHEILANVAMREGRYARCLHEIDALLAIDPNDSDCPSSKTS